MSPAAAPPDGAQSAWRRFTAGVVENFHRYGNWLAGITWTRFAMLALLLLIVSAMLSAMATSRNVVEIVTDGVVPSLPGRPPSKANGKPDVLIGKKDSKDREVTISISIGSDGVRIAPTVHNVASAASAASGPDTVPHVDIQLPPGADNEVVRAAVGEAKEAIIEAIREAREEVVDAAKSNEGASRTVRRIRHEKEEPPFVQLALLFIVASAIMKISYAGTVKAETKAAVATETAESEQLRRQVAEARMAALQAQVEPHFLFNTLASIDHLIETDPRRASRMQKNLIALLRASMPSLREAQPQSQNLGREMAVIRPYLEILKVRMEDRLQTRIDVPDGLLSAEFPPMMIQSLVENAIKHGLEPKAEGGELRVAAEIVHGKLAVTVTDTGLGFGRAATSGTGVGLENIRERLKLLYGDNGTMTVADHAPSGTVVTVTVPYVHHAIAPGATSASLGTTA